MWDGIIAGRLAPSSRQLIMDIASPEWAPKRAQNILDHVADNLPSEDIRRLGESLLRLADAIDQDWNPPSGKSIFRWPNELSKIERNLYALAERAQLEYLQRQKRRKFVPSSILSEPGWDMLLELLMQRAGKARVSVTSLCIASGCPTTTALRYLIILEESKFVRRVPAEHDRRVIFVELTDTGLLAMGKYLSAI